MGRGVYWIVLTALLLSTSTCVVIFVAHNADAYTLHSPIRISGDSDFTPENGVTSGTGTIEDPFVIEGLEISNEGGAGIEIDGRLLWFRTGALRISIISTNITYILLIFVLLRLRLLCQPV